MTIGVSIQGRRGTQPRAGFVLDADHALRVRIDNEANPLAGELVRNFEEPTVVGDGAILAHQTFGAMLEDLIELRGERPQQADSPEILLITLQRREAEQSCVSRLVINELIAAGPMPAFQLPLPLGMVRPVVNQLRAQAGADTLQRARAIGGAIVHDEFARARPRFNTACFRTLSIASAVPDRQNALCVISREASSMSVTRYVLRGRALTSARGPCSTSPYQILLAASLTKLRRSCCWLAAPTGRDKSCCCNKRWMAERESVPRATWPSRSSIWRSTRIERRGLSCLAASNRSCTAADSLERP